MHTVLFFGSLLVVGYSMTGFLGHLSLDPRTGVLPYDTQGLNMLTELGKLALALGTVWREAGSLRGLAAELRRVSAGSMLIMAVPAVLYFFNNNLGLIGFNYLSLTAGTMLSQLKIVVAGALRRGCLGVRLTVTQWIALVTCTCSTIIAVLPPCQQDAAAAAAAAGDVLAKTTTAYGVALYLLVNLFSALAAVWTEYSYGAAVETLRGQSFALRNAQLYLIGALTGLVGVCANTRAGLPGLLDGYTRWTWALLAAQIGIGVIVSLSLRHAGSMVKVLALPLFLCLSIWWDALAAAGRDPTGAGIAAHIPPNVVLGTVGVAAAIVQYSLPSELVDKVAF
jgi:hypothetical protein